MTAIPLTLPLSPLSGQATPLPVHYPSLQTRRNRCHLHSLPSSELPQLTARRPPRAPRGPVPILVHHSFGAVMPRADLRKHEGEVTDVWGLLAAPFNSSSGDRDAL